MVNQGRRTVDVIYQDFGTAWRDFGAIPKTLAGVRTNYNGRCVDADLNTIGGNGTKIQLWDCNNQLQQRWTRNSQGNGEFSIHYNGRCLDADLPSIGSNGTKVHLWDCNGSTQQRWSWLPDGSIRNALSGRCLDADLPTIGSNGRNFIYGIATDQHSKSGTANEAR